MQAAGVAAPRVRRGRSEERRPSMGEVTGSKSVVLEPLAMKPAGPPDTYLGVVNGMLPGVSIRTVVTPRSKAATYEAGSKRRGHR